MLLLPHPSYQIKGVYTQLSNRHNLALVQHIAGWVAAYPIDWHQMNVGMLATPLLLAPTIPASNYQEHVQAAATLQANMLSANAPPVPRAPIWPAHLEVSISLTPYQMHQSVGNILSSCQQCLLNTQHFTNTSQCAHTSAASMTTNFCVGQRGTPSCLQTLSVPWT